MEKIKKFVIGLFAVIGVVSVCLCAGYILGQMNKEKENVQSGSSNKENASQKVTVTLAPTATSVPTSTPVPTATSTPVPTSMPTAAQTNVPVPTATNAPAVAPTSTPTPKPTVAPTSTPTPTPTVAPTSTPTPTPTNPSTPSTPSNPDNENTDPLGNGGAGEATNPEAVGVKMDAFNPSNIHVENGEVKVSSDMVEALKELPQFGDLAFDEVENFIEEIYELDLSKCTTKEEIYKAILKYRDPKLVEFIANRDSITPPPQRVETPVEYTFTPINEVKITIHDLNLCEKEDGSGSIIGSVPTGVEIKVLQQCNQSYWYLVEYNSIQGYIHPDIYNALKNYTEQAHYTFTDMTIKMIPNGGTVNVRDLPCDEGNKIDVLPEGKVVMVKGKCNETGWYKIEYGSQNLGKTVYGYVNSSYLKEKPAPTPTATPKPTEAPKQNNTTSEAKPTATPKPTSTPSGTSSTQKEQNDYTEYAPAGEVFTDTVKINGELVEVTGTMRVHGALIVEGLEGSSKVYVDMQKLNERQMYDIWNAYQKIYGEDEAGGISGDGITYVEILINWDGGGFATGEGIQLNRD